jgi:hypothetical protein
MLSEYEKKRLENIESNKKILRELGLERPPILPPAESYTKKNNKTKPNKRITVSTNRNKDIKRIKTETGDDSKSRGKEEYLVRRSSRLAKLVKNKFIKN